jgi:hypothetical protein
MRTWIGIIGALMVLAAPNVAVRAHPMATLQTEPQRGDVQPIEPAAEADDSADPAIAAALDLAVDASIAPLHATPASPWRITSALEWQRAEKPDGSSAAVTVKRPLPLAWDAKIGADFKPADAPSPYGLPAQPLPQVNDRASGAAWARLAVPNLASLGVQVGADHNHNTFGASLSRSLPLSEAYSVTFEHKYAVSDPAAPPPAAVASVAAAPPLIWSADRLLKFNIHPTATTLAAGTTTSTADNVTRNKFMAEQKLYGPLNVTTAVTDPGSPTSVKSITAGFKLKW